LVAFSRPIVEVRSALIFLSTCSGSLDRDRVSKKCCPGGKVSGNLPFVVTNRRADGLTALGDPTRRAIFECLAERPRAVGELADALPVSRPAVSQHLKVLKDAGLVTGKSNGTRRIYRLNPEGVAAMRDQLDTYWNRALEGYEKAVDRTRQEHA
jgi:DNA-binding transcriptional ArsR family regulator